jgi:hypothetical protein
MRVAMSAACTPITPTGLCGLCNSLGHLFGKSNVDLSLIMQWDWGALERAAQGAVTHARLGELAFKGLAGSPPAGVARCPNRTPRYLGGLPISVNPVDYSVNLVDKLEIAPIARQDAPATFPDHPISTRGVH